MTPSTPPRLLERLVLLSVLGHDRDPVAGDLYEAYGDVCARRGRPQANLWYARHALSLAAHRFSTAERLLAGLSLFAVVYGLWFGTMSLLLGHPGQGQLDAIAATILLQALLTLSFLLLPGLSLLRVPVAVGCLPLVWLVSVVVRAVARGADPEGYILLMALSLALQSLLTMRVLTQGRKRTLRS